MKLPKVLFKHCEFQVYGIEFRMKQKKKKEEEEKTKKKFKPKLQSLGRMVVLEGVGR